MKNGISFCAVAGGPAFSREEEEVAARHFEHLYGALHQANPPPTPPGTEPLIQEMMSLWDREDGWEIAATLRKEERLLREHGEESWYEIEKEGVDQGGLEGQRRRGFR